MEISRRKALALGLAGAASTAVAAPQVTIARDRAVTWHRDAEGRRVADLGNGQFLNPIFSGDHPDPTLLRDGDDYYLTFSSFDASPGLLIWHSRDLVNWSPLGPALPSPPGTVFASDLVKHAGRYYLYIPFIPASWSKDLPPAPSIYVIHAPDIRGPWSEPIDLGIRGYIDPGHVVGEDGKRYLFLSGVSRVQLADDGLSTVGAIEQAYEGWKYPDDWITEAYALEGPKLFQRGDWFYLVSAVGGTSGPATSHMVIAARSRSIQGPWENCPHNPIVRTRSSEERWWSRGHATVFEGPDGRHWMIYHGYENGYRSLGRQVLLEPVRWDSDGWFHATGGDLSRPLPMPARDPSPKTPAQWSDDFRAPAFGTRWTFFGAAPDERRRARFEEGSLVLACKGSDPADSSPLVGLSGDLAYECSVQVDIDPEAQAGLLLFFNNRLFLGMGISGDGMITWRGGNRSYWTEPAPKSRSLHLRIVNDRQIVTLYYSPDGQAWTRHGIRSEVSGYNANTV
ncbi:MAG: hypothetical protein RLZZ200_1712, partial [Pseudomonadota bacterium]